MKIALKYYALAGAAITLVGMVVELGRGIQRHLDNDARQDDRIRVLERIAVAEHPAYSATIYWETR